MGCPRCGSDLEEFALGDSRSSSCPACGWVGVAVDLGPGQDESSDESWDDAIGRTTHSVGAAESPIDPPRRTGTDDGSSGADSGSPSEADGIPPEMRTLIGLDDEQANRLEGAGIQSVDGLASADPQSLAGKLDRPEEQIRPWIRRASILLVTDGAD